MTVFHSTYESMADTLFTASFMSALSVVGSRKGYHMTSVMQSLLHDTRTRVKSLDCSKYREITLLSTAGKILARVLLDRLELFIAVDNIPL